MKPTTEAQRGLLDAAKDQVRKLADTQILVARQLANRFPRHVLKPSLYVSHSPFTRFDRVLEILGNVERKRAAAE
jgi:hypothetical protein